MATRIRHARAVAKEFAANLLEQTEICWWAERNSDLSEEEVDEAQKELSRIAGRISALRAQQREVQPHG